MGCDSIGRLDLPYEQVIRPAFYGIYEVKKAAVEVYQMVAGNYQLMTASERGHYAIAPLGVELGIWQGEYLNANLPWLRWWDDQGNLLLTGDERAKQEHQRAEIEHQRAEQAEAENARLREQLRALGVNPDSL